MKTLKDWERELGQTLEKAGDQWKAHCPAHDDINQSLFLKEQPDGKILVYCHAGCTYQEILNALRGSPVKISWGPGITRRAERDPRAWWEGYTRIPAEEWESWGVKFINHLEPTGSAGVAFTWGNQTAARKIRLAGEKSFIWSSSHSGPTPHLWPACPEELPEEVWITEGETDCGTLRHLGFEAYALTKGAGGIKHLNSVFWKALHDRGAGRIITVFDADEAGKEAARQVARELLRLGYIEHIDINLTNYLDPILGQKDVRDLFLQIGDRLREVLLDAVRESRPRLDSTFLAYNELIRADVPDTEWLIRDVWLDHSVGLIVGEPRVGKTWLALDAAISIISGRRFIGWFEPAQLGPVVYVPREDSLASYQSRLQKVTTAKGLGGEVVSRGSQIVTYFPPSDETYPFFIDAGFRFAFTDREVGRLIRNMRWIAQRHGPPKLVILDPLMRMTSGIDLFRAEEVAEAVFEAIDLIRREFNTSVMLLHHKTKSGSQVGYYGSIAFRAFSESILYLDRQDDGSVNALAEFKGAETSEWRYTLGDLDKGWEITVVPGNTHQIRMQEAIDALASLGGSGTISDLVKLLGWERGEVYGVMKKLLARNKVSVNRAGRSNLYTVTV